MVERSIELGPHGLVTSALHFNLTPPYMYIRSAEKMKALELHWIM